MTAFVGKREQYCLLPLCGWQSRLLGAGVTSFRTSFFLEYLNGNIWFPLGSTYRYTPFAYMYTPLCLHVHPPLGNLKFPLHTKFSRQFKGLHMILSNLFKVILHCLKSFNIAVSAPSSLHMKRCKQACIRLDGRGCGSTSTSLPSTSLPSTPCSCETSTPALVRELIDSSVMASLRRAG